MIPTDWIAEAAQEIVRRVVSDGDRSDVVKIKKIITERCPYKLDCSYVEVPPRKKETKDGLVGSGKSGG